MTAREIALDTTLTEAEAEAALAIAAEMVGPERAEALVREIHGLGLRAGTLATLGHLATEPDIAAAARLILDASLMRHVADSFIEAVQRQAYEAGVNAADWHGARTDGTATADRRAAELARLADAAALVHAGLGRPEGYRYDGGPVDWETGRPAAPEP